MPRSSAAVSSLTGPTLTRGHCCRPLAAGTQPPPYRRHALARIGPKRPQRYACRPRPSPGAAMAVARLPRLSSRRDGDHQPAGYLQCSTALVHRAVEFVRGGRHPVAAAQPGSRMGWTSSQTWIATSPPKATGPVGWRAAVPWIRMAVIGAGAADRQRREGGVSGGRSAQRAQASVVLRPNGCSARPTTSETAGACARL